MRGIKTNGAAVRQLRVWRGWTQETLAACAGCSVRTIRNAEAGRTIDLVTLRLIAIALESEVSSLAGVEPVSIDQTKRNEALARDWHDLYQQQNLGGFLSLHHRNTQLFLPGSEGMSAGGTFRGQRGLRDHLEVALDTVPVIEVLKMRLDVIGNTVFARPTVVMHSTKTGEKFTISHVNELQIFENKVVRRTTYADYSIYRRRLKPEDAGMVFEK